MLKINRIDIFKPPDFERKDLNLKLLREITGRKFSYASMGRYALYHILKSFNVKDKILLPAYICKTILIPLKMLKITPIFYDISLEDLNPDISSIEQLTKIFDVKTVLVPSLYGNPANLVEIENLCSSNHIKLIDDSAQSFGSMLEGRYVGAFGDAGFFSFSPGKSTVGHMGALYWTNGDDYFLRKNNRTLFHYLSYMDFYFNRLHIYKYRKYFFFKIIHIINKALSEIRNSAYDDIAGFEKNILGGALDSVFKDEFEFRQTYFDSFLKFFDNNGYFRTIKAIRGKPKNHKFVILGNSKETSAKIINHLFKHRIYSSNGYMLITNKTSHLPNTESIDKRVVEIPIENDETKMNYLFEILSRFRL